MQAHVQSDFDVIARLSPEPGQPSRLERALLAAVPRGAHVLEVGCGSGAFARLLAETAAQVTAIDLSPEMIARARRWSIGQHNVAYEVADIMRRDFVDHFDCVVSIATLHHLPLRQALRRLADRVAPAGKLLVHDLWDLCTLADLPFALLAQPVMLAQRLRRRARPDPALAAAWAVHSAHDDIRGFTEIRRDALAVLPTARIRRHLMWRWTLEWQRPA